MPSAKPGPALFLGIELGIDQLRASIVDESLDLVGVECIDFDSDLPEYQYVYSDAPLRLLTSHRTQGGIFTTPGEAYTTPVEMWLKGLGERLSPHHLLPRGEFLPRRNQIFFLLGASSPIWQVLVVWAGTARVQIERVRHVLCIFGWTVSSRTGVLLLVGVCPSKCCISTAAWVRPRPRCALPVPHGASIWAPLYFYLSSGTRSFICHSWAKSAASCQTTGLAFV